jgi:hypothetical protein
MEQNEKPYQSLAWLATGILIIAAGLASFVPELEYHLGFYICQYIMGICWMVMERAIIDSSQCWINLYLYFRFNILRIIFF